jgi:hypothetical protein
MTAKALDLRQFFGYVFSFCTHELANLRRRKRPPKYWHALIW